MEVKVTTLAMVRPHPKSCVHFWILYFQFSSVQFSHSVMSDSLRPHELQKARPPCPSPAPGAYSNSCPSSQWCHPAISSSVVPFSSFPQSLPASGSFPFSHEMKRCLLLGRKVMTKLDSIVKKQRYNFAKKRSVWSRLLFFQWSCMDVRVRLWRKLSTEELMLLNCGVGEDSWESLGLHGDPTSPS